MFLFFYIVDFKGLLKNSFSIIYFLLMYSDECGEVYEVGSESMSDGLD